MSKQENMIALNSLGWGVYKLSIRDILIQFGLEEKDGYLQIKSDDPRLDIFPTNITRDKDGQIKEEYITDMNVHIPDKKDKEIYCNYMTDAKMENIELWKQSKFYPNAQLHLKNNIIKHLLVQNICMKENKLLYLCQDVSTEETKWINEDDLNWGWR